MLLTVELVSRVPVYRRGLAAVRILATTTIAAIAAFVSYQHMAAVALRYGETGLAPYLLPLSVDGLIVVASVSLVELAGRVHAALGEQPAAAADQPPETTTSHGNQPAPDRQSTDQTGSHNGHRPSPPQTPMPAIEDNPVNPTAAEEADPDLIPLLPAARAARDELRRQGRRLTRDSLAAQLRRDGHSIRTGRASALLNLVKNETPATANGRRPASGA